MTTKHKRFEEVFTCCSKCESIKPISYIPNCKCRFCNDNTKYNTFYFINDKRRYVSNKSVRYRIINGRPTRSVNMG